MIFGRTFWDTIFTYGQTYGACLMFATSISAIIRIKNNLINIVEYAASCLVPHIRQTVYLNQVINILVQDKWHTIILPRLCFISRYIVPYIHEVM